MDDTVFVRLLIVAYPINGFIVNYSLVIDVLLFLSLAPFRFAKKIVHSEKRERVTLTRKRRTIKRSRL